MPICKRLSAGFRVLLAFAVIMLQGCVSNEVAKLDSSFDAPKKRTKRSTYVVPVCTVNLSSVTDSRVNKSAGQVAGRKVTQEQVESWIAEGFSETEGLAVDYDTSVGHLTMFDLNVDVVKLYSHSITTSMSSNIVLKLKLQKGDEVLMERVVRGTDTSVNWASGEGEIKDSFTLALVNAIKTASEDIASECSFAEPMVAYQR